MASIKRNTSQQMEDTNDVVKTGYLKKLKASSFFLIIFLTKKILLI